MLQSDGGDRSTLRVGWTLLETLIAIGVMGVLLALSAPALRGASDAGRRAVCLNNLRWLHEATLTSAADHRDMLPFAERQYSLYFGCVDPFDAMAPYFDVPTPLIDAEGNVVSGQPFICPSSRDIGERHGATYVYMPWEGMAIVGREAMSLVYRRAPHLVLWRDYGEPHRNGPVWPGSGTPVNACAARFDGSVGWFGDVALPSR